KRPGPVLPGNHEVFTGSDVLRVPPDDAEGLFAAESRLCGGHPGGSAGFAERGCAPDKLPGLGPFRAGCRNGGENFN
ncbi:unnamed protein product, partial [Amoebophrya sp. A120]